MRILSICINRFLVQKGILFGIRNQFEESSSSLLWLVPYGAMRLSFVCYGLCSGLIRH